MIVLRPAIRQTVEKGLAVLVTEGYDANRLDSLTAKHKDIKILRYIMGGHVQKRLDSVSSLFVLGNGPAPFDFWQFEGVPTEYLGGNPLYE